MIRSLQNAIENVPAVPRFTAFRPLKEKSKSSRMKAIFDAPGKSHEPDPVGPGSRPPVYQQLSTTRCGLPLVASGFGDNCATGLVKKQFVWILSVVLVVEVKAIRFVDSFYHVEDLLFSQWKGAHTSCWKPNEPT